MKFKHRIWLLPAMTAVIVTIGLLVSSQMTSRTATALTRVEKVQYPTVEALRTIRAELQGIEESLQRAVAEGDQQALATAEQRATALRHALHELAAADASSTLDETLSSAFETYFDAAVAATRIMLGKQSGDATAAITRMQQSSQVLQTALTQAQDAAIAEFRALLASGTANISQSKVVSLVMAVVTLLALGVGSWILIGSVFRRLGG
ncbi:MAG TPA: hypothetical protein VKB34_00955, partial [Povalibacter sp.]|nr:hypothetical protein [Povalibacter sp.]